MTRRLNNANVSVYAWLLLNESKGYWAADSNVLDFEKLVNNFISWADNYSLEYDGIMIDSEPAFRTLSLHIRGDYFHFLTAFGAWL